MAQTMWTRFFHETQGYTINGNVIFQDNKSVILLEDEEGPPVASIQGTSTSNFSSSLTGWDVTMKYCPTNQMTSDYLTKSLHGNKFTQF